MKTRIEEIVFQSLLVFCIFFAVLVYGLTVHSNGDNIEHLHESWMIWQGRIPYKDFFQHHNPLIWYMFSPIVALLINSKHIFVVFNVISVLVTCWIVFFQAKILKKNGLKSGIIWLFACIMLSSYSTLYSTDFRPDTFMYLFFFMGIYYLFEYFDEKKLSNVVFSFFCFFLSFLCSQKIIFNLTVVALFVVFCLVKNKIKKDAFFAACVLPILCAMLFLCYLYVNDALNIYIKSNYLFNAYIPTIFERNRVVLPPFEYYEFYVFVPLAIISAIYLLWRGSALEKFLSVLFFEELFLRVFYFSSFLHYNVLLLMLSIMLFVIFLDKNFKFDKKKAVLLVAYILFSVGYIYQNVYVKENKKGERKSNYEFVFENTTPCDYVINGYYAVYNLKSKDPGFYSILLGQIDVLGEKLNIAPKDNINELIVMYKPKIVSGGVYWDTYLEDRGIKKVAHYIDRSILNKYYNPTQIGDLFILKKEYQIKECKKDKQ